LSSYQSIIKILILVATILPSTSVATVFKTDVNRNGGVLFSPLLNNKGNILQSGKNCSSTGINSPVIIAGNKRDLLSLTYFDYLDSYPALIFVEPENKDVIYKLLKDKIDFNNCESRRTILLVNKSFEDFVVELVVNNSKFNKIKLENSFPNLFKKEVNINFSVNSDDIYGFFTREAKLKEYKIMIDGLELSNGHNEKGINNIWQSLGSLKLAKGPHVLTVRNNGLEADNKNKKELYGLVLGAELFSISQSRKAEYEHLLKPHDIRYLFYGREKSFGIDNRKFAVTDDGNYNIRVLMKPKREFVEKSDFVTNISSIGSKPSLEAISGWTFSALNTKYKYDTSEKGVKIAAFFGKGWGEKEEVVLSKKFSNISVKERPYILFSCEMNELNVQEVEINIRLTDQNSWFFKKKNVTLKVKDNLYVINLYEKVKENLGGYRNANLLIDEVFVKFKKRRTAYLTNAQKKYYTFLFKNIAFLSAEPVIAEFKDELNLDLPEAYYYFDNMSELKSANSVDQIPWDIKEIYKLHTSEFVDLKENPVVTLNFPASVILKRIGGRADSERKILPNVLRVVLKIDFNGDNREDCVVETAISSINYREDGKVVLTINAYEEVKKRFSNKKTYRLLSIGASHLADKDVFYQDVVTKKLISYKEHKFDFEVGTDVLKVDNKVYRLPVYIEKIKNSDKGLLGLNVFLQHGNHTVNILKNDRLQVEMLEIRPESKTEKLTSINYKIPKITFKKVNPTRYIVGVNDVQTAFILIFSESYHVGWKAYVRQKSEIRNQQPEEDKESWSALLSLWRDRGNRIDLQDHFMVNGYANGWIVPANHSANNSSNDSVRPRNFQIMLEYQPQRLFEIGLMISLTVFLLCLIYMFSKFVMQKGKK